jgi:hypothetical protein
MEQYATLSNKGFAVSLFCLDLLWQLPDNGGSTCAANS